MSRNVLTVVPANAVSLRRRVRDVFSMTDEALTCSVVVATMVEWRFDGSPSRHARSGGRVCCLPLLSNGVRYRARDRSTSLKDYYYSVLQTCHYEGN